MTQPVTALQYFEATWEFMPQLRPDSLTERVTQVAREILRGYIVFWVLAQVLKPLVRLMVLPASWFDFTVERTRFRAQQLHRPSLNFFRTVVTPDKAQLDVFVVKRGDNLPCILVCNPNGASFTSYGTRPEMGPFSYGAQKHPMQRLVEENKLPFNIVFFDYRCVSPKKWSKEALFWRERELLVDVASVWQFAKQSLNAPIVHTTGHSLGGMVSAITRDTLKQKQGIQHTDRSPASIDAFLRARLGDRLGAFGAYLASLAGFTLEAQAAFSRIGEEPVRGLRLATWHRLDGITGDKAVCYGEEGAWSWELKNLRDDVLQGRVFHPELWAHQEDILHFNTRNGVYSMKDLLTHFLMHQVPQS